MKRNIEANKFLVLIINFIFQLSHPPISKVAAQRKKYQEQQQNIKDISSSSANNPINLSSSSTATTNSSDKTDNDLKNTKTPSYIYHYSPASAKRKQQDMQHSQLNDLSARSEKEEMVGHGVIDKKFYFI